MTRVIALTLVVAALVLVLTWELTSPDSTGELTPARPLAPGSNEARVRGPNANELEGIAATVVARPLFSPDRRPANRPRNAVAAEPATGEAMLPRLTGTIVGPGGARALFADANGKTRGAVEGDSVAGFTVQIIVPGAVTVLGPEGPRVLRPSHVTTQPTAGMPRPQGNLR